MINVPRWWEEKWRIRATLVVALIMITVLALFKKEWSWPDTRAHISLEEIIGKKNPEDFLPLLDFVPDEWADIQDMDLVDSLTTYILSHTWGKVSKDVAASRARDLILWSMLFDVPLDMIVGHAHCESHFWTAWKGKTTHNMLNVGNTDGWDERVFSSFQLGTFAACVNIAWRLYYHRALFGKRETIDYTSIWTNRDTITKRWFLPNQLNYNQENPFRWQKNPAWAYMSDIWWPKKIWKKIKDIRWFVTDEDFAVELVDTMTPWTVYYEKTVSFLQAVDTGVKKKTYYSFSYLTPSWAQKTVGELRAFVADMLWVASHEITVVPYDHSRENTIQEDKLLTWKKWLLYFLYMTSTQQ